MSEIIFESTSDEPRQVGVDLSAGESGKAIVRVVERLEAMAVVSRHLSQEEQMDLQRSLPRVCLVHRATGTISYNLGDGSSSFWSVQLLELLRGHVEAGDQTNAESQMDQAESSSVAHLAILFLLYLDINWRLSPSGFYIEN